MQPSVPRCLYILSCLSIQSIPPQAIFGDPATGFVYSSRRQWLYNLRSALSRCSIGSLCLVLLQQPIPSHSQKGPFQSTCLLLPSFRDRYVSHASVWLNATYMTAYGPSKGSVDRILVHAWMSGETKTCLRAHTVEIYVLCFPSETCSMKYHLITCILFVYLLKHKSPQTHSNRNSFTFASCPTASL